MGSGSCRRGAHPGSGSGKSFTPLSRMHWANLRAASCCSGAPLVAREPRRLQVLARADGLLERRAVRVQRRAVRDPVDGQLARRVRVRELADAVVAHALRRTSPPGRGWRCVLLRWWPCWSRCCGCRRSRPVRSSSPRRSGRPRRGRPAAGDLSTSLLHPWIVRRVGVHGRAAVIDGFGAQLVVPGFVAVDLAQPVRGAVLRTATPWRRTGPMSTASPDTWADVLGVATQRAASASEPYFETASRSSCSWYAGERQPLSTTNSTPSSAASVAARRRAPRSAGSRLATPGTSSSKTVVPSGTAPSASPSAPRCSPPHGREVPISGTSMGGAAVDDEDAGNRSAEDCGERRDDDRAGRRRGACESGSGGSLFVLVRCRSCRQSRQRGVASAYAVFDMPAICAGS